MNILHINTNDNGGAAIAAIRLHYLLLEKGINSKMLFLKRSGKESIKEAYYFEDIFKNKQYFSLILILNSIYNRRFTFFYPKLFFNGPDSLFNIKNHYLFNWADIIHLHWVIKFLDWKRIFKHTNKKFVWTFHDMNPFTGGEHYKTGYNNEFKRISKRNIFKKTNAVKATDITIVSPSYWLMVLAKDSPIFKGKKITTIRNPINTKTFNIKPKKHLLYEKYSIPYNKNLILFVAENLEDQRKGFQYLLETISLLNEFSMFHLLIIGKETPLTPILTHTFLGYINDEDIMCEIYNLADVFVIPSLEDNFPNTVSEALLCGTPVAGFNIGGLSEIVHTGKNGFLTSRNNNLYNCIMLCLSSTFTKQNIRNSALIELNTIKLLNSFIQTYKSVNNHY